MEQQALSDVGRDHEQVDAQGDGATDSSSTPETGYASIVNVNEEGQCEISVLVHGVHCAACIQKIETALNQRAEISAARLNFSTQRLHVKWSGAAANANEYADLIEGLGYEVHPFSPDQRSEEVQKQERFLLLCLGVAGFAMGNIMLLSVGVWSSSAETMGMATRNFMHWVSALIALPTLIFSGRPFFYSALSALKNGHTNMDVPISVALFLTAAMSLYETVHHGEHVYFDSAVMLTFFLLIGRYLDFRARKSARSAATNLLENLAGFVTVLDGNNTKRVLIHDLAEGMEVLLASGQQAPIDGVVTKGSSQFDTALVTGETIPRIMDVDDHIYAGMVNLDAPVTIKVSKTADDSLLSEIVKLMEQAGQSQARYVRLADKAARIYTPAVHSLALFAFLGWFFLGQIVWQDALLISVTVLIITCPCALGLAVPVVQVLATGRLMKDGILVKSGDALERLASVDTVLLDKTGTLTIGCPVLQGDYDDDLLKLAASIATHSEHPLSRAICQAWSGDIYELKDIKEHPGKGVEASYKGHKVQIGSRTWCGDKAAPETNMLELWLRQQGSDPVVFHFEDQLRADSEQVIESLSKAGLDTVLLSGDRQEVVEEIARQAGIEQFYAEKTPPEKFKVMENLQEDGHTLWMIGDGLNDAPVLAGADVSMAPGTAVDISQNAADIVFMGAEFMPVLKSYKTASAAQRMIKQNFALAIGYNIVAIPLALMGLVTPLVAALAMSGSSLLVIANSFRLKFSS